MSAELPLPSLLALAVALAMDAFAVAVATGVCLRAVTPRQTFRLAWHFGLFQTLMPVLGWTLGLTVRAPWNAGRTGSPSPCWPSSACA